NTFFNIWCFMKTNTMKLQAPFDRLRFYENNPDIALRKAIVLQAIIDSTSNSSNPKTQAAKREARAWIFGNSEYF
ncbi:MAG: hypothetical protein V4485_05885, partial [Pseudomonadota bacterium]